MCLIGLGGEGSQHAYPDTLIDIVRPFFIQIKGLKITEIKSLF